MKSRATYRETGNEAQRRVSELRDEVERLRKRAAELSGVVEREASAVEELRALEEKLRKEERRERIDLDSIKIATPCNADWNAMSGNERVRFCGSCEKNVYNLSAMTRDEAEELVREKEGKLCTRFFVREDGTMLTQDCPVGVRKKRVRLAVVSAIGASALAFGMTRAMGVGEHALMGAPLQAQETPAMLGSVAPPIPQPPVEPSQVAPQGTVHALMGVMRPQEATMGKPPLPPK